MTALAEYTNNLESPQEEVVNNISTQFTTNASNESLLQMIKKMIDKVEALKQPTSTDINPRSGKKFKRYCWSCGCCTHWGQDCLNKKSGLQDNTNFKNRMGGSNKNCLPVQELMSGESGLMDSTLYHVINKLKNILYKCKLSHVASNNCDIKNKIEPYCNAKLN